MGQDSKRSARSVDGFRGSVNLSSADWKLDKVRPRMKLTVPIATHKRTLIAGCTLVVRAAIGTSDWFSVDSINATHIIETISILSFRHFFSELIWAAESCYLSWQFFPTYGLDTQVMVFCLTLGSDVVRYLSAIVRMSPSAKAIG